MKNEEYTPVILSTTPVILSEAKDLQSQSAEHEMVETALPSPICSRSAYPKQASFLLLLNRKFHCVQHDRGSENSTIMKCVK